MMLLFKSQHVLPILEGRKVQTRRVWAKARVKVGAVHQTKTRMFPWCRRGSPVFEDYPTRFDCPTAPCDSWDGRCSQLDNAEPFAHIRVTGLRQEPLGNITGADAQREGYPSVADYQEAFTAIYGWWDPDRVVWVVDFELAGVA